MDKQTTGEEELYNTGTPEDIELADLITSCQFDDCISG